MSTQYGSPADDAAAFMNALHTDIGTPLPDTPYHSNGTRPPIRKLRYVLSGGGTVLSFSRLAALHSCARRFQLGELLGLKRFMPSAHTAFGHAFAAGVQEYLAARSRGMDQSLATALAMVCAVAAWDMENVWARDKGGTKCIERALLGIQRFIQMHADELLEDYEVAAFGNKQAVELFFYMKLPNGYSFQGHIDLVLRHRVTGELLVLEIKTEGGAFNIAKWSNSAQALGYNCILNAHGLMSGQQVSYHVLYLHFDTVNLDFTLAPFSKPLSVSSEWLTALLLEVQMLELYASYNVYPKNGADCYSWGRTCDFYGTCDLTSMQHMGSGRDAAYDDMPIDEVDIVCDAESMLQYFTQQEVKLYGEHSDA